MVSRNRDERPDVPAYELRAQQCVSYTKNDWLAIPILEWLLIFLDKIQEARLSLR